MTTHISSKSEVRLISGDPSREDRFKGGAHNRVAKALVEILTADDGGKAVGLEGSWGSGKSSVIEIASDIFAKSDENSKQKHCLFIFDAWAHQGDPILRVFLDELIVKLDSIGAVNRDVWTSKLTRLRSRRKETIETKAEKLTWPARLAILMLPLWPVAYLLLDKAPNWRWLAVALIAVPYAAALFWWFRWNHIHTDDGRWFVPRDGSGGKSVLWAFTQQTDQTVTDQLIREEEATTIEFNRIFDELICDAKRHSSRVVIVLDNLDRLPPDLIRSVWATMRNFFAASSGSERQQILENVRLVVPFDRTHIESVFDEPKIVDVDGEVDPGSAPGFIEKTFDIVLRVSPPLLSNWKTFLEENLRIALGRVVDPSQEYKIFKLFDLDATASRRSVTPRAILSYLNAIVAQYKQWGDEIPLEYQALYVLNRGKLARDISALQSNVILDPLTAQYVKNWPWTKYVASAHFNVAPDDALEVLLSADIRKGLLEGDAKALLTIQPNQGFDLVLHSVIMDSASEWASGAPQFGFTNAIAALSDLKIDDVTIDQEIWARLADALSLLEHPINQEENAEKAVEAVLSKVSDGSVLAATKNLVRSVSLAEQEPQVSDDQMAWGEYYFELVEKIADAARARLSDADWRAAFYNIPLQGTVWRLYGVARAATKSDKLSLSAFQVKQAQTEVSDGLVQAVRTAEVPEWFDEVARGLLGQPKLTNWPPVRDAILHRLQNSAPTVSVSVARPLLEAVVAIPVSPKSPSPLQNLVKDNTLQALAQLGIQSKDEILAAVALERILVLKNGDLNATGDHHAYGTLEPYRTFVAKLRDDPKSQPSLIDNIAKSAAGTKSFSTLADLALSRKDELLTELLRKMVEREEYNQLSLSKVLQSFDEFERVLGAALTEKFVRNFASWDIAKSIDGAGWEDVSPAFVKAAHRADTKHYRQIFEAAQKSAAELPAERWQEMLRDEEIALSVLLELTECGSSIRVGAPLFDALQANVDLLVDGSFRPSPKVAARWYRVPEMLEPMWNGRFYVWLRDRLIQHSLSSEQISTVTSLFGRGLVNSGKLTERAGGVVTDILDPLLAAESPDPHNFIRDNANFFRSLILTAEEADRELLSHRLAARLSVANSDASQTELNEIARALGIDLIEEEATAGEVKSATSGEEP